MIVSSTYEVTELHYTFGCATLSAAFICNPSLQNKCVLPYLWLRHLWVEPIFLSSTYKISRLHYTYKFATFTVSFVCKLYLHHHRVKAHLWRRHPECSLYF